MPQFILVAIRFRWIWVEKLVSWLHNSLDTMSQSAFAGYGLKRKISSMSIRWKDVAIRFRWIWVEKYKAARSRAGCSSRNPLSLDMGWKGIKYFILCRWVKPCRNPLSLDMGWKEDECSAVYTPLVGRNPLSLDMGWKVTTAIEMLLQALSQSAFAGYGLKRGKRLTCLQPTLLVAIRFRWIWVEKHEEDPDSHTLYRRNPLSLDMGWKVRISLFFISFWSSRNPLSLDMGWKVKRNCFIIRS